MERVNKICVQNVGFLAARLVAGTVSTGHQRAKCHVPYRYVPRFSDCCLQTKNVRRMDPFAAFLCECDIKTLQRSKNVFPSLNLLIGWQLSVRNCCKPFFPLLYNCQLLCFWQLPLSIVIKVFPRSFFRLLLLQGYLLQTRYA